MHRYFLRGPTPSETNKPRYCATCRCSRPVTEFYRLCKVYKGCNQCAELAKARRQKNAAEGTHNSIQHGTLAWPANELSSIQQQAGNQILQLHQEYLQRQHQEQVASPLQETQHDPRMASNNLVFDSTTNRRTPAGASEQSQRITDETQNHYTKEANRDIEQGIWPTSGLMGHNFYRNIYAPTDTMQHAVAFGYTYDNLGVDLDGVAGPDEAAFYTQEINTYQSPWGMYAAGEILTLPEAVLLDEGEDPVPSQPFNRSDSMVTGVPNAMSMEWYPLSDGLSASQVEALSAYNASHRDPVNDTMDVVMVDASLSSMPAGTFDNIDAMPIDTVTQGHAGASAQATRKSSQKTSSIDLNAYFAEFCPTQDLLYQPLSVEPELTGELQAKRLINELGLAFRLLELHQRWRKWVALNLKQIGKCMLEVELLDRLEGQSIIVPWVPLSNWLLTYEACNEDIADRYKEVPETDWIAIRRRKAEEMRMMKSLLEALETEVLKLIENKKVTLTNLFVELTGQNDALVIKKAFDKQLRVMKNQVAKDCYGTKPHDNALIVLEMDKYSGIYVLGT